MPKEALLLVPGLGDNSPIVEWNAKVLGKRLKIPVIIHTMPWLGEEQNFDDKLSRLLLEIDNLVRENIRVSLLGTSAGGSAVLNAFALRQDVIEKVVNVCGRLRAGENVHPTLEQASKKSSSFRDSVLVFEKKEKALAQEARQRVLTIRPVFDEIVPVSTMTLEGAHNVQILSVEHILSIGLATTLFSSHIANFLSE